jgi:hypothetical protein
METYIKEGKDYIENELHYSFKSMETSTIANRLLKAFMKGFNLSKEYWQKDILDQQASINKVTYTEEEVKNIFDNYRIFRNTNACLSIYDSENWFEQNKKK